jgi:prepilin-type N-terminal cleavage/methylation domain-containing protein
LPFKTNNRGFTLLEVLVAIVLLLIGAIVVARMQVISMKGNTFGKEAMVANMAAQKLIEQLRDNNVYTFAAVLAGGGGAAAVDSAYGVPGMTIQWAAGPAQGTAPYRYTTITATLAWSGKSLTYRAVRTEKDSGQGANFSASQ